MTIVTIEQVQNGWLIRHEKLGSEPCTLYVASTPKEAGMIVRDILLGHLDDITMKVIHTVIPPAEEGEA